MATRELDPVIGELDSGPDHRGAPPPTGSPSSSWPRAPLLHGSPQFHFIFPHGPPWGSSSAQQQPDLLMASGSFSSSPRAATVPLPLLGCPELPRHGRSLKLLICIRRPEVVPLRPPDPPPPCAKHVGVTVIGGVIGSDNCTEQDAIEDEGDISGGGSAGSTILDCGGGVKLWPKCFQVMMPSSKFWARYAHVRAASRQLDTLSISPSSISCRLAATEREKLHLIFANTRWRHMYL